MASLDYYVGFETEPESLDDFLEEQGYDLVGGDDKKNPDRNYESRGEKLIEIFYFSLAPKVKEGEVPDWKGNGYTINCELMISTKEDAGEAERIAYEATRRYNGVLYDPKEDKFSISQNTN